MSETPSKKPIRRHQAVRRLLALYDQPRYLEVGVCKGETFHKVHPPQKVAVDPLFQLDHKEAERATPGTRYHQVTSDEYFGTIVGEDELFDVIYLDGLHTFEQTLRDLTNALQHLQSRGVILIDDVRPPSHLASIPDRAKFVQVRKGLGVTNRAWMGDVYKLLWFIDTFRQQLTYRTIRNNHGQAVVWRQRRESVPDRTVGTTDALTFEDLVLHKDVLRLAPFGQILKDVKAAVER